MNKMTNQCKFKKYSVKVDGRLISEFCAKSKSGAKGQIPYNSWLHGVNYKIKEIK